MVTRTMESGDAKALVDALEHVSGSSAFHLKTAIEALGVAGVGGTLVIEIPNRVGEHVQAKWLGGVKATLKFD